MRDTDLTHKGGIKSALRTRRSVFKTRAEGHRRERRSLVSRSNWLKLFDFYLTQKEFSG